MSFPLVLFTSPLNFAGEHEMLEAMFAAGLTRLHLRKPGMANADLERWLLALSADWRSNIVIHGEAELAVALDLAGCHAPVEALRAGVHLRPEFAAVSSWSVSLHAFPEIQECPAGVHYAFLSPIFDSISKTGYRSAFRAEDLHTELTSRYTPDGPAIYGLGGVDAESLEKIRDFGFAGAGVLGAVWNAPDPVGAWQELMQEAEKIHA